MFQLQLAAAALNCKGGNPVCSRALYSSAQKSMDSGYPLDWFIDEVDEKLICEICGKVLQSPRATPCCSNVFCLHCLEFWIEYYGVCPKRCGEIDGDGLQRDPGTEKSIQSLKVHCKYQGCKAKMTLEEKIKHEKKCQHRTETTERTTTENTEATRKQSTQSAQDTYVEMASVACRNRVAAEHDTSESRVNLHPIFSGDLAYYTYELTRRSPGESLGFVLVAGAKNSNGKAVNFSIKTVNPNTVAAEVGLLPCDRIVQVDNIPLSQLAQSEAISRIKDNPHVILTVIRSNPMKKLIKKYHKREDHVYEDIPNTEEPPPLLLPPERSRDRLGGYVEDELGTVQRRLSESRPLISPRHLSPTYIPDMTRNTSAKLLTEKMSKDSGLSSSSSSSPAPIHFSRQMLPGDTDQQPIHGHHFNVSGSKHSYKIERQAVRRKTERADDPTQPLSPLSILREDHEIEEIYLEKNGTNQLGITLGYDTKSATGNLIVCEIVPDGLAAQDGRLQKGDIIHKVNGFEVYDPEEAILLFLEQDQDISLTVARKIKTRRHRRNMLASKSQNSLNTFQNNEMDGTELRRTDSCGSLDSCTYREETVPEVTSIRRHSESSRQAHKISVESNRTFHVPIVTTSTNMARGTRRNTPPDFAFRPINEVRRPATAGDPVTQSGHTRYLRSTTSLGSDPERSIFNHQQQHHHFQHPVVRHRSFEGGDQNRLRSPTPLNSGRGLGYGIPSPLKNSSRSFFSDGPRMTDQVAPFDRSMMNRSISNFRCESLV